jgi:hypothetical protein
VASVVRLLRETTERVGLLAECPDDEIYARELADSQDDLRAAAAAVAELIAADKEYDEALRLANIGYATDHEDRAAQQRLREAIAWRRAALSNIEGAST